MLNNNFQSQELNDCASFSGEIDDLRSFFYGQLPPFIYPELSMYQTQFVVNPQLMQFNSLNSNNSLSPQQSFCNYTAQEDVRVIHENSILSNHNAHNMGCADCGEMNTSTWRNREDGLKVCNSCGLYRKKYGMMRPTEIIDGKIRLKRKPTNTYSKGLAKTEGCSPDMSLLIF
ncbi:8759_t:CDS:2 [Acaulospora morrowiae]|uniref:8759_t:CDS:1 n=1 Tax=Acaulospora morrowiae TaxID=94023 RepID=A0A9N9D087_9GLOM|nr:8759_t:CDS:2 [Acaulospora morrowiae]